MDTSLPGQKTVSLTTRRTIQLEHPLESQRCNASPNLGFYHPSPHHPPIVSHPIPNPSPPAVLPPAAPSSIDPVLWPRIQLFLRRDRTEELARRTPPRPLPALPTMAPSSRLRPAVRHPRYLHQQCQRSMSLPASLVRKSAPNILCPRQTSSEMAQPRA